MLFSYFHLDVQILAVGLLAFLVLRAAGAPLTEAPTAFPSTDTSSEEETESSELLSSSDAWDLLLDTAKYHQKSVSETSKASSLASSVRNTVLYLSCDQLQFQFEDEFQNNVKFHLLEDYKISQLPANCPTSNFSKVRTRNGENSQSKSTDPDWKDSDSTPILE